LGDKFGATWQYVALLFQMANTWHLRVELAALLTWRNFFLYNSFVFHEKKCKIQPNCAAQFECNALLYNGLVGMRAA